MSTKIITNFYDAIEHRKIEKIKKIIHEWPEILYRHNINGEAVFYTICMYMPFLIPYCIKHGADINMKINEIGDTPLIHSIMSDELETAKMLIKLGADVNKKDAKDFTPLMVASTKDLELVKLLIEYGANVNALNKDSGNALHYACISNNIQVVEYLLFNTNIDYKVKDYFGHRPLELLSKKSYNRIKNKLVIKSLLYSKVPRRTDSGGIGILPKEHFRKLYEMLG
jgi:hypothetical protein